MATRIKNEDVRTFITKTASKWGIAGTILGSILLLWYLKTLPANSHKLIGILASKTLKTWMIVTAGLMILYFLYAGIRPLTIRLVPAILAIVVIFGGIWSTERIREMIRKPYIIPQYMYSNQIIEKDIPAKKVSAEIKIINEKGILKVSPFVPEGLREINDTNMIEAGKLIARIECLSCHTLNETGLRPLPQMIKRLGIKEVEVAESFIDGLSGSPYMPPFVGTPLEKKALASYLVSLNR